MNVYGANVMHVCFDIRKIDLKAFDRPVVTLGTFDGVHLGHQAIIRKLIQKAAENKSQGVVVTYEPHPQSVVSPEDAPRILTTLEEKLKLLEKLGVQETVVMNFDEQLKEWPAREFVEKILVGKLDVGHLVVGDDHAFGKGRSGKTGLLRRAASKHRFGLEIVAALHADGIRVSSTRIRRELEAGEFARAANLLGHGYPVSGAVVRGKGRGRELEYPTLNLKVPPRKLLPKDGVYSVRAHLGGRAYTGMMYIGPKLTFGEHARSVEVHLFGPADPSEVSSLEAFVESWVRSPQKFSDPDHLRSQLKSDEEKIKEMFRIDHSN